MAMGPVMSVEAPAMMWTKSRFFQVIQTWLLLFETFVGQRKSHLKCRAGKRDKAQVFGTKYKVQG